MSFLTLTSDVDSTSDCNRAPRPFRMELHPVLHTNHSTGEKLLGLNTNAGEKVSLRLLTDDLDGLRSYNDVRRFLLHVLTHNVFGGHGNDFKEFNSQLNKEVAAFVSLFPCTQSPINTVLRFAIFTGYLLSTFAGIDLRFRAVGSADVARQDKGGAPLERGGGGKGLGPVTIWAGGPPRRAKGTDADCGGRASQAGAV